MKNSNGNKNPNWKGGKIEHHCIVCNTIFYRKMAEVKKGFNKFCCRKCYWVDKKGKMPKNIDLIHKNIRSIESRAQVSIRFTAQTPWNKGLELPQFSGENHPNWKGGRSPLKKTSTYRHWRISVLKRDHHTCIWCGSKENLEVDHIKPFVSFEHLRFEISNGRTLCHECHRKTDTYGYKAKQYQVYQTQS